MTLPQDLKLVIVGAGAIGGSLAAWTAQHHHNTFLLARGPAADIIAANGLTLYHGDSPAQLETIPVNVIRDLREVPDADVVILATKLYNLEPAAQQVKAALGDRPLVVSLQNGIRAQHILPEYFPRVVYGVVAYNAWLDEPGRIGYQRKGPVILGTLDNSLPDEQQALSTVLGQGLEIRLSAHIRDATCCKLALNMTNSVTTLLGLDLSKISDLDLYQRILAGAIYEAVQVIRTAGVREQDLAPLPSWKTLWVAAKLPHFLTRRTYRQNLHHMNLSSMAQDVFTRKSAVTELDDLNGEILRSASLHQVNIPINRAVYRLCQQHFADPNFQPLDVRDVWREIQTG
jgi:2-dehydropantoate 2-reductase